MEYIIFEWVKTHNLRDIDIKIPKNKITTITWVSWSGKSSLAFDTIYKEWQFRYIESLSSYLRQFFNLWDKPDIEYCSWLSPAIAIEQNKRMWNSRSTVWTLTEIDDYLRLLFSKLWHYYCYNCWNEIKPQNIDDILKILKKWYLNEKIYLLQEAWKFKNLDILKKFVKKNRNRIEKWKWFTRYLVKSLDKNSKLWLSPIEFFYLEEPNIPEKYFPISIFWIYDRITLNVEKISRLKEDIIKILQESPKFWVYSLDDEEVEWFTDKVYCPNCNIQYSDFKPQHFSFNRQEWACPDCHWVGQVLKADMNKIIDPNSLYLKAILPWRDSTYWQTILKKLAVKYNIEDNIYWKDLPTWFQHIVINWDEDALKLNVQWKYTTLKYDWVESVLKEQYANWFLTVDFQAMLDMKPCPTCNWSKLRKESLYTFLTLKKTNIKTWFVTKWKTFLDKSIDNKKLKYAKPIEDKKYKMNIQDLHLMTLSELDSFLVLLKKYSKADTKLVDRIIIPLLDRVKTIKDLWLWYLNLHRQIWTLSWWEVQRLRLSKQLWNKLTWIIYVLDEPTIWLSEVEIKKVIFAIKKLKELWNTIIVVEHNESFIKASDWIIEIWKWAGDFWWNLIFQWNYKDFLKSWCLTSEYILWNKKIDIKFEHKYFDNEIKIHQAFKNNLKKINVSIKLWSFTIITWHSGAGKTTLMYNILYRFLNEQQKYVQSYIRFQLLKKGWDWQKIITAPILNDKEYLNYKALALQEFYSDVWIENITWVDDVKNIIYVDQSSIWKTPRSCPATFIWVFDKIRNLFAWTDQAKYLWFTSWYFSFNSSKWACPACKWYWYKKVELQFLPDTYIACELCHWKRYKPEILWIKWHWKTISDVLNMYVEDALKFFYDIWFIKEELELMVDIWLWYLKMGQPAHTLSWWESQRLKLVKHLLKSYTWHTIYFLDEPTVGLHFADIEKLLKVLKKFLDNWNTILMIEHDKNILKYADFVIKLDNWKIIK